MKIVTPSIHPLLLSLRPPAPQTPSVAYLGGHRSIPRLVEKRHLYSGSWVCPWASCPGGFLVRCQWHQGKQVKHTHSVFCATTWEFLSFIWNITALAAVWLSVICNLLLITHIFLSGSAAASHCTAFILKKIDFQDFCTDLVPKYLLLWQT